MCLGQMKQESFTTPRYEPLPKPIESHWGDYGFGGERRQPTQSGLTGQTHDNNTPDLGWAFNPGSKALVKMPHQAGTVA